MEMNDLILHGTFSPQKKKYRQKGLAAKQGPSAGGEVFRRKTNIIGKAFSVC